MYLRNRKTWNKIKIADNNSSECYNLSADIDYVDLVENLIIRLYLKRNDDVDVLKALRTNSNSLIK